MKKLAVIVALALAFAGCATSTKPAQPAHNHATYPHHQMDKSGKEGYKMGCAMHKQENGGCKMGYGMHKDGKAHGHHHKH